MVEMKVSSDTVLNFQYLVPLEILRLVIFENTHATYDMHVSLTDHTSQQLFMLSTNP